MEWFEDLFDAAAWVALATGQSVAAATLLGAAATRWDLIEPDARTSDREWHADLIAQARSAVGSAWVSANAAGADMSPWQAVRFARDTLLSSSRPKLAP